MEIVTLKEQPELVKEIGRLHEIGWPAFMRNPWSLKDPSRTGNAGQA